MTMPLPSLSIPDLQAGSLYLSQVPLANPLLADQRLMAFLEALTENPPAPDVLLSLLEQTRAPLSFTEEEIARRYHNKPLLLTDEQEDRFERVISAWRHMAAAYSMCMRLHKPPPDDPHYSTLAALVLHRRLYYTGLIIVEHFRARREVPAGIWQELHGHYETAEQLGVTFYPVQDSLESDLQATHCTAAYVTLLLIDVASPYSNSVRDLSLIHRWAIMWAPLVALHPVNDEYEVPPYLVELRKDLPLHPTGATEKIGSDARLLDTSRLGLQLSHMLSQLHQRLTPSQLGLGEETPGHVIKILERLSRPWTQSTSPRRFRRFASEGTARVVVGFEAIHFFVGGEEFIQQDSAKAYSRGEFDELFTFRDRVMPGQQLNIRKHVDFSADEWTVINHSANGFRLSRSHAGGRIAHGQLLSVCPHDGEHFLLGQATWLMQEYSGGVVLGIALLPGLPQAVAIRRATGQPGQADRFVRAFLLPPVAAIGQESSIVIPTGLYKASGLLEIVVGDKSWKARMLHVRQAGVDFDRISYETL